MKKRILITCIAVAILTLATAAMAADNFNLTVTAQVVGTCRFTSGSGTLDIGSLDFDAAGNSLGKPAAAVTNLVIQYWCTKGVNYDIAVGATSFKAATQNFARTLSSATSGDSIPYTLVLADAGRNPADGPAVRTDVTMDASVAAGAYDTAGAANDYTDTVTIDVTP